MAITVTPTSGDPDVYLTNNASAPWPTDAPGSWTWSGQGSGVEVIDIGMCTTPMLYFAAATLCQSGIQITGSHNPKDYNGFKMVLKGAAVYGEQI